MLNRAPYKDVDTAETLRARAISYQPKAAFENWFGEPWDYVQVKKCKDYAILMVNDYAISDTYSLIGSDAKMRALVNEHLDEIAAAKGKVICVSHVTSGLLDAYPQTLYVHGHTHDSPYVTPHKAGYFDVETGSLAWTGDSSGSQKKENWKRYVWIFEFFKDRVEARLHQFGNQYVTAEPDETETLPPQE